jgi:hypothetical protein
MSDRSSNRGVFFAALMAATLLPYWLFPLHARLFSTSPASVALVGVVLFLGAAGHVAASFFFYTDAQVRGFIGDGRWPRYVAVPIALVALAGVAFATLPQIPLSHLLVVFWVWQVHHFTRQNNGILAFASRAYHVPIRTPERLAITLTDVAAILATVAFITPYRDTLLADYGWHMHTIGIGVYACAVLAWLWARPWQRIGSAPVRELFLLAQVGFYLPLFVFKDAFSAVYIYLTAHGLQYLVFMAFVTRRPVRRRVRAGVSIVALIVLGGGLIKLFQDPGFASRWGFSAFGLALGITMWHFVLDAGVWRLSEPFQRGYMSERFDFLRS